MLISDSGFRFGKPLFIIDDLDKEGEFTHAFNAGVSPRLRNWNGASDVANSASFAPSGTVWMSGDSTTANFTALFTEFSNFTTKTGELLSGVTLLNRGSGGASLASYLADGITYGISATIAAAPQLIMFCWGINDVRSGACGSDYNSGITTLRNMIITAVDTLRAALPNTDIVLVIPNSLGSDDPGATGYVPASGYFTGLTQAERSQMATDIMWNAYIGLRSRWPNVTVIDKQTGIYGRTCQPVGTLLADVLHPVNTASHAITVSQFLASYAGYRAPFSAALSAAAWAANPTSPWTVYSRAIEDPEHCTLIVGQAFGLSNAKSGRWSSQTVGSFIDFVNDVASNVQKLDYIEQAFGAGTWQIPTSGTTILQQTGMITRILLPGGLPTFVQTGGTVNVWRKFA